MFDRRTLNRKLTWPLNAIFFNCLRVITRRDKKLWVFGAHAGNLYDDNSRYLIEYINGHHKDDIRAVWLTCSQKALNDAKEHGVEAYLVSSPEGRKLALKAGVAFYTHSLNDFGDYPMVGGAVIVALWHGMGFKKIYNDVLSGRTLVLRKTIDKIYSRTYRTISIVTSRYTVEQHASIFNLKPENMYICGQPRNDVLKSLDSKSEICRLLGLPFDKRIVMYMPTYRSRAMGENCMENIIKELYNNVSLKNLMNETNSVLLVKPHPLTAHVELPKRDDFVIMDYDMIESNQKLLSVCDMLITDYSSCCVDYALLEKPVIFYMPDHEKFMKMSEPLYDVFFDLCKLNKAENVNELCNLISKPSVCASKAINEIFEDKSIANTCYSENVYLTIKNKIKI